MPAWQHTNFGHCVPGHCDIVGQPSQVCALVLQLKGVGEDCILVWAPQLQDVAGVAVCQVALLQHCILLQQQSRVGGQSLLQVELDGLAMLHTQMRSSNPRQHSSAVATAEQLKHTCVLCAMCSSMVSQITLCWKIWFQMTA